MSQNQELALLGNYLDVESGSNSYINIRQVNRIINGAFDIWQRGTGPIGPGTYNADRWRGDGVGMTSTRSTDVPNSTFLYSNEFGYTGTDSCDIEQRIEAVNCRDLAGKTVTVSFWYKGLTGSVRLAAIFAYPSAVDNWASYTYFDGILFSTNPSTSWTYYSGSITLPSNVTNGMNCTIQRGDASTGPATGRVTGIQLELGSVATPFERRPIGQEIVLCERYFQKSYDLNTAPGTVTSTGYINWNWGNMMAYATATVYPRVRMRTSPTMTNYNHTVANTVGFRYWNGSADVSGTGSISGWAVGESVAIFQMDGTSRSNIMFHWTAAAEL